ncbi:MAG: superoxide dismutase family protein [Gammaproteobacteria bacterium]|nr:superoxide dismutase family protein [Gammaproteobacteria bacterium]
MRYCLGILLAVVLSANAAMVKVSMYRTNPQVKPHFVGTITATDTAHGLLIVPNLYALPTGLHGFHVHQNRSCGDYGKAAGPHYDPKRTGRHLGPYNNGGHLGDLPALYVNKAGLATLPVLAPRLKVRDIMNHTLMIHADGDNYSDNPYPNGGGGSRLACGLITAK